MFRRVPIGSFLSYCETSYSYEKNDNVPGESFVRLSQKTKSELIFLGNVS